MVQYTRPADGSTDLAWPFGKLEGLDREDLRMTAYEVFFTSCRSSPGFGGRSALTYYPSDGGDNGSGLGSPVKAPGVGMAVTSRIKRALGLKMLRRSPSRRTSSCGSNPGSPIGGGGGVGSNPGSSPGMSFTAPPHARPRRPMTSAEIMRQQMRVTEQSDNRLRKTLMRTLVGQMGRRAETIILPLELLRHLKPSEFNDSHEYHLWQKRQLKILEAGLLLQPSIPLEKSNTFAMRLREIIRACDTKAIDTGKNSETMRTLCNCVVSLSWRSPDGSPTDVCHWADGFPLNVHLYIALLHAIFDIKDETLVLDEIDELLELMKKTWSTLAINRSMHNLCFTWVLFEQYITTGQVEGDLLGASLAMLAEVANDAKKVDREPIYVKMLAWGLSSMKRWLEKRLFDYHGSFHRSTVGFLESILPLVFSATKILEEDVPGFSTVAQEKGEVVSDSTGNRVDHYIRTSLRNAFAKMKFMLNEQEFEAHLTKKMVAPTEGQSLIDHAAYQKWNEKDRSACYSLLSSLQNDLIGHFDELPTCKCLWDQLKFSFRGTLTKRLRSLAIKFKEYTKDPKHTMSEHRRMMSNIITKLKDADHALTNEQGRAVIKSLPASWANMKHILTHSENIKNFSDVSQHVILEAEPETRDADRILTYVAQEGSHNANGKRGRQSKKGKKGEAITSAPKEGKMKKRKRGKCGGKKDLSKVKCFNCQQKGHFARDCTEPKKVLSESLSQLYVSSHVMVAHSQLVWFVDTGATKHVAHDREGFVDYHRIPLGSKHIFMGNNSSEEVLGVGSYQLKLRTGSTLILKDVRYAPTVRLNLLSVTALLDNVFFFIFRGNKLDIFLDDVLFGHGFRMDSLFQLDLIDSQSSYS
ncbi:hypothetical protein RJ640_002618 [Escallonia rubra]|uniref:CCHC-type domain-containing protein n=1 Tax=Escallonia rubra TaxID=112253 RepID=A0AA88QK74_9ASTE|nr:hypothetical protein RJ640_002618 [Escallonia rubra]